MKCSSGLVLLAAASVLGACKQEVSVVGVLEERHQVTVKTERFEQCDYSDAEEVAGDKARSEQRLSSFGCVSEGCEISGSSKVLHDTYYYPMLDNNGTCIFAEFEEFESNPYYIGSVEFGNKTLRKLGLSVEDLKSMGNNEYGFSAGKDRRFSSDYETHYFSTRYSEEPMSDTLTILGRVVNVKYGPKEWLSRVFDSLMFSTWD